MKRSNAPVFWLLFGAGGMLSALIGAMLVFISGIAAPHGIFLPSDALSYTNMLGFAQHWAAKGFLFVIITLFLWHSVHRIFHSLHDIGLHTGFVAKIGCYGFAFAGTIVAGYVLHRIGWAL